MTGGLQQDQIVYRVRATDLVRPLLFRRLLSPHPALPTPGSSSVLRFQVLHTFRGLRSR
jgi:hypothetical protein